MAIRDEYRAQRKLMGRTLSVGNRWRIPRRPRALSTNPTITPAIASKSVSKDQTHHIEFGGAQRLQDPDLARSLHNCGVHGLEDHDEANDDGDADHNFDDN